MEIILILFLFVPAAFLLVSQENLRAASAADGLLARGKYIVEQVSMRVECHTPRDQSGQLIRAEYLRGAPVPVKAPPYPNMSWALNAPAIAGLPGYNREEGIRLLTKGITAGGKCPDLPMPPFRFNRADAEAVCRLLEISGIVICPPFLCRAQAISAECPE